jgi:hypothetical protein
MKYLLNLRIACFVLFLGVHDGIAAQSTQPHEYQLKAVFLFHFTQFVDWPEEAFRTSQTPLVIGILGNDPFGDYLDEVTQNENVNGHPLVVKRYRTVEEIGSCHLLYINTLNKVQLEQVFDQLKTKSILTVGDSPKFLQQGGMIQFVTKSNTIDLRINIEVVKAANLTISSKLLRLAEIVSPNDEQL